MHSKDLPPRLLNRLLGTLLPTAACGPSPQQTPGILFRRDARFRVPADLLGGGELPDAGVEVAEDGLGTGVYSVAGGGGEVGRFLRGRVVGEAWGWGVRGAARWGGGGEVGLAD